jgi:hypothetical protein
MIKVVKGELIHEIEENTLNCFLRNGYEIVDEETIVKPSKPKKGE